MVGTIFGTVLLLVVQSPTISTFAGRGQAGYAGDGGPASEALLNGPFGLVFDRSGNLFLADTGNHCVRRIDARIGVITTVAGFGKKGFSGDGGPAPVATLNEPYGLAIDREGNLFIADRLNHRIRRVDAKTGIIKTVAGSDKQTPAANGGPATEAAFLDAGGIALDGAGHLLIADVGAQRIWSLDLASGELRPFAGTGRKEHAGDGGPALTASLNGPRAVAVAPDGTVIIVEREGHRVCAVDPKTGRLTTLAGTGRKGYSGDSGPAKSATFNGPKEVAVDSAGNIFVVDTENHAIRRIDARTGLIGTVAGDGQPGGSGDGGPARSARLNRPHGVAIGPMQSIMLGDTNNHRVRRILGDGDR